MTDPTPREKRIEEIERWMTSGCHSNLSWLITELKASLAREKILKNALKKYVNMSTSLSSLEYSAREALAEIKEMEKE